MKSTDWATLDRDTLRLWVDLDLEGELPAEHEASLAAALEASPDLQQERQQLAAMHQLLDQEQPQPRADFAAQVMAGLPRATWEKPSPTTWWFPVALVGLFSAASVVLFSAARSGASENGALGLAGALFDFLSATWLAGAGLLGASWRGVGLGLEQLFAESQVNLLAMGFGVLMLNLLFFSLLRRRRPKTAEAESSTTRQ